MERHLSYSFLWALPISMLCVLSELEIREALWKNPTGEKLVKARESVFLNVLCSGKTDGFLQGCVANARCVHALSHMMTENALQ